MPEKNIAMKHYQQFSSHHLEHAKKKKKPIIYLQPYAPI
jgi:hypothetical protein